MSGSELDRATTLILNRLNLSDRKRLLCSPNLLHLLSVWKVIGSEKDVRKWAEEQQKTDVGLMKLLEGCREWRSSSSKGLYFPLNRSNLLGIIDIDRALMRLTKINSDSRSSEKMRRQAAELLEAARQGQND